ncbi:hypothetical protein B0H63DRAFT_480181 [Podospora didyma]|uniref:Uncharacterized protein n=1 Tax=Podospora didyma TaxID=330526 RepID=A0AAE0KMC2_9PEZI|nr:hypothetical protein B0H63DRAFT_480181 [Podospora didyma]
MFRPGWKPIGPGEVDDYRDFEEPKPRPAGRKKNPAAPAPATATTNKKPPAATPATGKNKPATPAPAAGTGNQGEEGGDFLDVMRKRIQKQQARKSPDPQEGESEAGAGGGKQRRPEEKNRGANRGIRNPPLGGANGEEANREILRALRRDRKKDPNAAAEKRKKKRRLADVEIWLYDGKTRDRKRRRLRYIIREELKM